MVELGSLYEIDGGDVVLRVQVSPGAGRSTVVGRHGDSLKLRVTAPPVGGRANDAARGLLAEAFGLKDRQVSVESGEGSRSKRFRLGAVEAEDFQRRLHLLVTPEDRPRPT